jgi:hypothetical protein
MTCGNVGSIWTRNHWPSNHHQQQALTVVGIAPPEYTGMITGWAVDLWLPAMILPLLDPSRGNAWSPAAATGG